LVRQNRFDVFSANAEGHFEVKHI